MTLERLVVVASWIAIASAALGLAASVGSRTLPELPGALTAPMMVAFLLLGVGAAFAAALRQREIDRERFHWTKEPGATRDEIKTAHEEAERRLKLAYTALGAAPLALAYWLAYELPEAIPLARALPVAPLVGFGVGTLLARRRVR
ncbi:MAG TPA: hypothetical protein VLA66_03340 [Thermoanaerobaculia bacterium]|nr:hypothetical protein [Thermoanaerobaculia bacterium]